MYSSVAEGGGGGAVLLTVSLGIWAAAGREGAQHADSDAGWRLGRHDSGLNLDPTTHTGLRTLLSDVRRRVRVRV